MYNEAIKQQFVDSEDNTFTAARARKWIFDAVGIYENKIAKDCAEMGPHEAIATIENSGLEEIASVRQVLTTMRDYANWCEKNHIFDTVPHGFEQINVDDIDFSQTFREVLYKDSSALIADLNTVGDFNSGSVDVMVFILSWLGLFRNEMEILRDEDVDLENRVIYGTDSQVLAGNLSDEIIDVLNRYRKCQVAIRRSGPRPIQVRKDNSIDNFLKKMLSNNSKKFGTPFTTRQLEMSASRLAKRFEEVGKNPRRLTMANVWRSGSLYRLWQMEQETGLDMGNLKRRDYIEKAFRKKKNYTNTARMYRWYKKVFWE